MAIWQSLFGGEQPASSNEDLRVSQIWIYPIKSCKGIRLDHAEYSQLGFDFDRRWMIVDGKTNKFLTARDFSKMVLIETAISGEDLIITIPSNLAPESYTVPLRPSASELEDLELIDTKVWADNVDGYLVDSLIDEALSVFLQHSVKLVLKGPKHRDWGTDQPETIDYPQEIRGTAFADGYPFLISSEASMKDVRSSVEKTLKGEAYPVDGLKVDELKDLEFDERRMRPNIVIEGNSEPYAEDGWYTLEIGEKDRFHLVSRCARCTVPNVDPNTGIRSSLPWSTMSQYRKMHEGVSWCFGVNACPQSSQGRIQVGQSVKVVKTIDPSKRPLTPARKP